MSDTQLLPCPFCGGDAQAENTVTEACVRCLSCRATLTRRHTANADTGISEAATAWNARRPISLLHPASIAHQPKDAEQARRAADYYRNTLKPFA